ncbi:MAG: hypothetical protein CVU19_12605 [Betaproteobacteria bacterium HGW-Betaproteobacteria-13]|uniref:Uncharacterized protein n=2 Tax=Parazoarcus communis TaxID=41977 RepID=A0A2U8H051_9RHOO|nr:hypothetical protein CEW87_06480 [Parazoarcus communis]PKO50701.1 MAG: hypothetical protein CVU28_12340 [Betaproteobacteria bacterium HGW-Betaproteobacteria-21]PKO80390.1 MAG: hypothetical protein CVU19_12605 [Betaproteobacteria bacterium HGW-Betaproteobacteria-13]
MHEYENMNPDYPRHINPPMQDRSATDIHHRPEYLRAVIQRGLSGVRFDPSSERRLAWDALERKGVRA